MFVLDRGYNHGGCGDLGSGKVGRLWSKGFRSEIATQQKREVLDTRERASTEDRGDVKAESIQKVEY